MNGMRSSITILLGVLAGVGFCGAAFSGSPATPAPGFQLQVTRAGSGTGTVTADVPGINCPGTCTAAYNNGTPLTLVAIPAAGHQFTGWLGPCTGAGACQFTIQADTTAVATFASPPIAAPVLDIDANTSQDALTDGLLVLRSLLGASGPALTGGAVGPNPGRNDAQISGYLVDIRPLLDADGNGKADALTDGLLIIRYLFGLRGEGMVGGAVGPGASRDTAQSIEARMQDLTVGTIPAHALGVSLTGSGSGTVTSSPAGITCGVDCSENYQQGLGVVLSAVPAIGSAFTGWSGGGCTGAGSCGLIMDAARSVTASFSISEATAVFVDTVGGVDGNPGTALAPKQTLAAAIATAAAANPVKSVYASKGVYAEMVTLADGVNLYGGYDAAAGWSRSNANITTIASPGPVGISGSGLGTALKVQQFTLTTANASGFGPGGAGQSSYGILLVDSPALVTLSALKVTAGNGALGLTGGAGAPGSNGGNGGNGGFGQCDGTAFGAGGGAGSSVAGRPGGVGGNGGVKNAAPAQAGAQGTPVAPGGSGGSFGDPGGPGGNGTNGTSGSDGAAGRGGTNSVAAAGAAWAGQSGAAGSAGTPGDGGGGGGGGGGQHCFTCIDGSGNGGGGGGGGGSGGTAGSGGAFGGGSFGLYLFNAHATVLSSSITSRNGGTGGGGGGGGSGGFPGAGGSGGTLCTNEVGKGGSGGNGGGGGTGGNGGGGAGGPSIGIFRGGTSTIPVQTGNTFLVGIPGFGGAPNGAAGTSAAIVP